MFRKLTSLSRYLSRKSRQRPSSRATRGFRPTFEPLEHRMLLSISMTQWATQDIVYTTTNTSSNWYTDSRYLQVTFTPPSGSGLSNIVTKGFWDGASTFKVRFTPTIIGTWTYSTTGSTINSLTNQTEAGGSQIVVSAASAGDHGFLRCDANYPNSCVWDDGTRYFMWGNTYYNPVVVGLQNDNWKVAIDGSASYGMNKIAMNVYNDYYGPSSVHYDYNSEMHHGYPDVQPYVGTSNPLVPNRDELNLAYWAKLDEVVEYLDAKGIVADLILTTPYSKARQFGTDAQNDRFINYTLARYAAYTNVMWHLCWEWEEANDYSGTYKQEWADFNRMGLIVRNNDPWMANGASLRPLTIHDEAQAPWNGMEFDFLNQGWATHISKQLQTSTPTKDQAVHATVLANLGNDMPVAIDEYGYIGTGSYTAGRTDIRRMQWAIATAGAYGTTGDFRTVTDTTTNPVTTWKPAQSAEWLDAPEEYGDLKNMIDFFTTKNIEYWKMATHDELKSGVARNYLLAEPGRQYVLYAAAGDSAAGINLTAYSGNFNVVRYDPTNGAMLNLGAVAGGATRTWNLAGANSIGGNDWVLLVTALDVPGVVPAVPTALAASVVSGTQVNLTWTDTSSNETAFKIDRATNSTFTSGLTTATVASNVTSYQSTGLTPDTTYYYRVRASIGGSNDSANSNTASATTTIFDVTWTGAASSTWSTATSSGNWKKTSDGTAADFANTANVRFDNTATGFTVVISAADVTPASVAFHNTSTAYTITGTKGIAGANTTVKKQGAAMVIISSVNTYGGVTTLEGGRLVLQGVAKAMAPVLSGGGTNITGGVLVLDYTGETSPAALVGSLLAESYNVGSGTHFNTGKFQSTIADATHGLGWIDNPATSRLTVVYTLYGDANLDGTVDLSDLTIMGQSWSATGRTWAQGDFNYDGVVNLSDLTLLGQNWKQTIAGFVPTGMISTPELIHITTVVAAVEPAAVMDSTVQSTGGAGLSTLASASAQGVRQDLLRRRTQIHAAVVDRVDLFALAAYELSRRNSAGHHLSAIDEYGHNFPPTTFKDLAHVS